MIVFGSLDQNRIDIDTHHVVARLSQKPSHSAGAAARIQNARDARGHRINQPGLANKVRTVARHRSKAFDIADRVPRIGFDMLHPETLLSHTRIVASEMPVGHGAEVSPKRPWWCYLCALRVLAPARPATTRITTATAWATMVTLKIVPSGTSMPRAWARTPING